MHKYFTEIAIKNIKEFIITPHVMAALMHYFINLFKRYSSTFIAILLLMIATYSYFFSSLIFSNHIFPNAFVDSYPSYRTLSEGRWFADIVRLVAGGSGVQTTQMMIAVALQIVNGFLFSQLLRVTDKMNTLLIAAFLSLHPVFLDYYSFTSDHISFVLGDTLALLGVLALDCLKKKHLSILCASFSFVLVFATYQPKIALVIFLLIVWCVLGLTNTDRTEPQDKKNISHCLSDRLFPAAAVFIISILIYYLSLKLTISFNTSARTHINEINEMIRQIMQSYPKFAQRFIKGVDYLPDFLQFLPIITIFIGTLSLILTSFRYNYWLSFITIIFLLIIPIVSHLSSIINTNTDPYAGRILAHDAYILLFFLFSAWNLPKFRFVSTVIMIIFVYFFFIIGGQEANAAAFKNIFDVQKINRVVSRIENAVPELYQKTWPIVVVGHINFNNDYQFRRYKNSTYTPHIRKETFEVYRQFQILNFFLGRDILIQPTQLQVESALTNIYNRRIWPAPESVYLDKGTIVIILEKPGPNVPVTWAQ